MTTRSTPIHEVYLGRMTPEEAEAEAARLGLQKLAKTPDPTVLDPMKEVSWTLIMVLAWIMWRTMDAVRDHWDAFRLECEEWVDWSKGRESKSRMLKWRKVATLVSLSSPALANTGGRESDECLMTFAEAKTSLWLKLGEASLLATATTTDSTVRRPIPSYRWPDLNATTRGDVDPEAGQESWDEEVLAGSFFDPMYLNVTFAAREVIVLWPPRSASGLATPAIIRDGPGRPTSMRLVKAEFGSRWARGVIEERIGKVARGLSSWLRLTHPEETQLDWKTIANNLRDEHRLRKKSRK
jgi:hypothetical protein